MSAPTASSSPAHGRAPSPIALALLVVLGCHLLHELFVVLVAIPHLDAAATVHRRPVAWLPLHVVAEWDADYYRANMERYQHFAWPPLYTSLLRAVAALVRPAGDRFVTSALIVNLASHLGAAWALVRLADPAPGRPSPSLLRRALGPALLLLWPFHNAYYAAYSESLFVALAALCLLAFRRERFLVAALLVVAAFLTRTAGMFLGAGLLVEALWRAIGDRRVRLGPLLPGLATVAAVIGWDAWLRAAHGVSMASQQHEFVEELVRVHVPRGMEPRLWVALQLLLVRWPDVLAVWLAIAVTVEGLRRRRERGLFEAGWVGSYLGSFLLHAYRPFSVPRVLSTMFPLVERVAEWASRRRALAVVVVVLFAAVAFTEEALLFSRRMGEP